MKRSGPIPRRTELARTWIQRRPVPPGGDGTPIPVQRDGLSVRKPQGAAERSTRRIMTRRSEGISEYTGTGIATDASHRVGTGVGGEWSPSNLVHLERYVHAWCHANPAAAKEAGLMLESWQNPEEWPVWLPRHSGWVYLRPDGRIETAPWAPMPARLPKDPR